MSLFPWASLLLFSRFHPVSSGLLSRSPSRRQQAAERERERERVREGGLDCGSGACGLSAINAWNMTRNPNRCTAHWLGLPFRLPGFSVSSPLCSCARDEWYVSELFVRFLPVRVRVWGREWVGKLLNKGLVSSSPIPIILNYLMHIYNRLVASVAFSFSVSFSISVCYFRHLPTVCQLHLFSCFVALTICSGFACQMNYLCFSFYFFFSFLLRVQPWGAKWNICGSSLIYAEWLLNLAPSPWTLF